MGKGGLQDSPNSIPNSLASGGGSEDNKIIDEDERSDESESDNSDYDEDCDYDALAEEDGETAMNTRTNSAAIIAPQTQIAPKKKKKKKKLKKILRKYAEDGTINYHEGTNRGKGPDDPDVPNAYKKLQEGGTYVHSVDVPEDQKPDWFMYGLFGGGKEAKIVARREKESKKKLKAKSPLSVASKTIDLSEYSKYPRYFQEFTGDEYQLVPNEPPAPVLSATRAQALREAHHQYSWLDTFFRKSKAEQQILLEIDHVYGVFLDLDEICCHIYHTENCCWERSIGYDIESVLEIAMEDESWIDSPYSRRLVQVLFIHMLNYMHLQKTSWRCNSCAPGIISLDVFRSIALKALQDNAEEALGVFVILFYEKLVGDVKIRFENYGHTNTDCGFGSGDDGSGFTQLKGCIQNVFRILIADQVECCTAEKEVLTEDAHVLLAMYDLINDEDIGEITIAMALEVDGRGAPNYIACNIRYFNVNFLDRVLFLMGCDHDAPFYDPNGRKVLASVHPVSLTRENFTTCAMETIASTMIPAFQLLKLQSFFMDEVYEYIDDAE